MEEVIDRDSLRIVFKYLFTLKNDSVEGEGLYSQITMDVDLADPICPPHLKYRWSDEKIELDRRESLDWANVRSVCKVWRQIADEEFDFGGHITPIRLAANARKIPSMQFLLRKDDTFYPCLILVACNPETRVITLNEVFVGKPKLFDKFIESLVFNEENTRVNKSRGYLTSAELILNCKEAEDIIFTDERITNEQFQMIVEASCWARAPEFLRRAMKDPRTQTPSLGFHLNRNNWTEGMGIYIDEGGNQEQLFDILVNPRESVQTAMSRYLLEHPNVESRWKYILVLVSVLSGNAEEVEQLLPLASLNQTQISNLIYNTCSSLNEDAEGKALRVVLKYSTNPPVTALDAAVSCGSLPKLKILLEDGRLDSNETFYIASVVGNLEMMRFLINSGYAGVKSLSTALKKAFIMNEPEETIELLFNAYQLDDSSSQTIPAIFFSPLKYLKRFVVRLCEQKPNEVPDWINFMLVMSPFRDDSSICEYLYDSVENQDILGLTMISAASVGRLDLVMMLLENKKVDISYRNYSCVRMAKENGHEEVYQYLLDHGGKLDPIIHPVHYVRKRWLLQMEIQIEAEKRAYITDPLLNNALTQYLNDKTAALNTVGPRLLSRLIGSAVYSNNIEMMETFLQDPNLDPTVDNHDAFLLTAKLGRLEAMKLFLKDPRIDVGTNDGEAIRLAVESGNKDLVILLLETGKANLANSNALISACDLGYWEIARRFLSTKEINLSHYGVPSFICLVQSVDPAAKEIARSIFEETKEALYRYDPTTAGLTFEQVFKLKSPKRSWWYESKWFIPVEIAVIASTFALISYFSAKRTSS